MVSRADYEAFKFKWDQLPCLLLLANLLVLLICQARLLLGVTVVSTVKAPSLWTLKNFVTKSVYRCHCVLEHKVNLIVHNSLKANCPEIIILAICPKGIHLLTV